MAKPVRPASDAYPSVCCPVNESVSFSSDVGLINDDDDQAPIFSISKSSMDVMATGPPHKRDPAWTRLDLRRSSSTNTHTEQNPMTLKQMHTNVLRHENLIRHEVLQHANSHQLSPTTQDFDLHSPPALSDRWMSNMQRWSGCSAQSRSSTPDTVVWKGGSSRPSSITQDGPSSPAPDSPMSKLTSPPPTPSPLVSPLHLTPAPSVDNLTPSSSSTLTPTMHEQDHLTPSSSSTLTPTMHQPDHPTPSSSSTLTPTMDQPDHLAPSLTKHQPEHFPESLSPRSASQNRASPSRQMAGTEKKGFPENNQLAFQFPSPIPSCECLAEAGESSDPRSLVDDVIEKLVTPRMARLSDGKSVEKFTYMMPNSPAERRESKGQPSLSRLELPWQPEQTVRRSPLVSSLSDSGLGQCCRCQTNTVETVGKLDMFRDKVKCLETVDAAVQTASPMGSWWDLRRNNSNMGSHSILGSPPGSRLNLKSSVGSNSNLVSPSSSMFPVSSGDEDEKEAKRGDDPTWDVASTCSHDLERRRSCLKMQQSEDKDELGRRSSMKQVQWDEDGMTWDVHGASVDPEVLCSAIRKHLELQNSPRPLRRSSKKTRAPKPPILTKKNANANPPVTVATVKEENEKEAELKPDVKQKETPDEPRRRSRAEADLVKDDEVYGEEGVVVCKSPSRGSGRKSVIRSLRPGWCGGSRKTND